MTLLHQLMDPAQLLAQLGPAFWWIAHLIVLIECGLFFPILPGDSLLFAVGMFTHEGAIRIPLALSLLTLTLAAFAGNVMGYEIGRAVGARLYERDGRLLKRRHFERTIEFFDRYGRRALVIGRFVPIVRTFVTVVAGVGRMPRRTFLTWSAVGAVLWVAAVTSLGYALGGVALIRDHLEAAVLLLVVISVAPMAIGALRRRGRGAGRDRGTPQRS
ncbi:VTT domain-containing protein [Brachybacterium halotolerans subsp. kimchii]|uniref:DedA family protein n=1 Tax=Brachybacterium halotolerans TaxID=2795215 RepID=UPI001E2DEA17|nr:VTT domain-containing protein [Brachybacterium halotolerans]UEJ83828.1 VTT domain-containing protein [Brachybacterium halotolerans subsp. kimchii]